MKIQHADENGKISFYELKQLLETATKVLNDMPLAMVKYLEDETAWGVREFENTIVRLNNRVVEYHKSIDAQQDAAYEKAEECYHKIDKAVSSLNERLSRLPKVQEVQYPTYTIEKLLDIAERTEHLTDKQWERLIELAKALGEHP